MPRDLPLRDLLKEIADALATEGARWYVFGAQAVIMWGRPRLTADLDVTVEIPIERAQAFARFMEENGFDARTDDVAGFVGRTRVLPLVHRRSGIPVDIVLAGPGLELEFLERAIPIAIGDSFWVPFISPEDLVVTKMLAGRPKDLDDIDGVLRERMGELDLGRVRSVLFLLESALDRSDLVEAFDARVERA